jgi:hypothetical protein
MARRSKTNTPCAADEKCVPCVAQGGEDGSEEIMQAPAVIAPHWQSRGNDEEPRLITRQGPAEPTNDDVFRVLRGPAAEARFL